MKCNLNYSAEIFSDNNTALKSICFTFVIYRIFLGTAKIGIGDYPQITEGGIYE